MTSIYTTIDDRAGRLVRRDGEPILWGQEFGMAFGSAQFSRLSDFGVVHLPEPPAGPQHTCELPPPSLKELFSRWLTTDTSETFDEYVLRSR
jgi:hypothetical protein